MLVWDILFWAFANSLDSFLKFYSCWWRCRLLSSSFFSNDSLTEFSSQSCCLSLMHIYSCSNEFFSNFKALVSHSFDKLDSFSIYKYFYSLVDLNRALILSLSAKRSAAFDYSSTIYYRHLANSVSNSEICLFFAPKVSYIEETIFEDYSWVAFSHSISLSLILSSSISFSCSVCNKFN